MKSLFLWFVLFFSFSAFCVEASPVCSKIGVELWGETLFVEGKKETKERDPMPSFWNTSSEVFDSLYIKSKSREKLSKAVLEISSKKGSRRASFKLAPKTKGWWRLENADFRKHVMPKKGDYPARLKLRVYGKDSLEVCAQTYRFGVVK